MGPLSKMPDLAGSVSEELLDEGLLGRGIVVGVQQTSVSTGADPDPSHVCVFTVEVALDNVVRYTATCRQAVRASILPQLVMPGAMVALRVDPKDHDRIALSLGEEPPTVTIAGSGDRQTGPAELILEQWAPCVAVIVQTQSLGMRSPNGDDLYAFGLTVVPEGRPPYQIQVGSAVPAAALPLLYPGTTVPAKRMPDGDDREFVIDWEGAIAQLATTAA